MIETIMNYVSPQIMYIVGTVLFVGLIYLAIKFKRVRLVTYTLMINVEKFFKSEAGKQKKEKVIEMVREIIPRWLRWYFTKEKVGELIEKGMYHLKDYLHNGKFDDSIKDKQARKAIELEERGDVLKEINLIDIEW